VYKSTHNKWKLTIELLDSKRQFSKTTSYKMNILYFKEFKTYEEALESRLIEELNTF